MPISQDNKTSRLGEFAPLSVERRLRLIEQTEPQDSKQSFGISPARQLEIINRLEPGQKAEVPDETTSFIPAVARATATIPLNIGAAVGGLAQYGAEYSKRERQEIKDALGLVQREGAPVPAPKSPRKPIEWGKGYGDVLLALGGRAVKEVGRGVKAIRETAPVEFAMAYKARGRLAEAIGSREISPEVAQLIKEGDAKSLAKASELLESPEHFAPKTLAERALAEPISEVATATSKWLREKATQWRPKTEPGTAKYYVTAAIEGVGSTMVPAVAASLATKNPGVGLAVIFPQVFGNVYAEQTAEGKSTTESANTALFYAASEAITEIGPLGVITKVGGKRITRILKSGKSEGLQETLNQAMQEAYDEGILGKDTPPEQIGRRLLDSGIIGTIGGTGLGVVSHGFAGTEITDEEASKAKTDVLNTLVDTLKTGEQTLEQALESLREGYENELFDVSDLDLIAKQAPDLSPGIDEILAKDIEGRETQQAKIDRQWAEQEETYRRTPEGRQEIIDTEMPEAPAAPMTTISEETTAIAGMTPERATKRIAAFGRVPEPGVVIGEERAESELVTPEGLPVELAGREEQIQIALAKAPFERTAEDRLLLQELERIEGAIEPPPPSPMRAFGMKTKPTALEEAAVEQTRQEEADIQRIKKLGRLPERETIIGEERPSVKEIVSPEERLVSDIQAEEDLMAALAKEPFDRTAEEVALIKRYARIEGVIEPTPAPIKAFGMRSKRVKPTPTPKKAKVVLEEVGAEKIPTFKTDVEAKAFGKTATPEQVAEMEKLRQISLDKTNALMEQDKLTESSKESLVAQLYKESIREAPSYKGERALEPTKVETVTAEAIAKEAGVTYKNEAEGLHYWDIDVGPKGKTTIATENLDIKELQQKILDTKKAFEVEEVEKPAKPLPPKPAEAKPSEAVTEPIKAKAIPEPTPKDKLSGHTKTLQEYLKTFKKEIGKEYFEDMKYGLIKQHYNDIETHIKAGGKITQKVFDSLETDKQKHFNKHYNFRDDKIGVEKEKIEVTPEKKELEKPTGEKKFATKNRLLKNIKDEKGESVLINDLAQLGADAIRRGHTSFKAFSAQMKTTLNEVWDKIKHLMQKAYDAAKVVIKSERGEVVLREPKKLTAAEKMLGLKKIAQKIKAPSGINIAPSVDAKEGAKNWKDLYETKVYPKIHKGLDSVVKAVSQAMPEKVRRGLSEKGVSVDVKQAARMASRKINELTQEGIKHVENIKNNVPESEYKLLYQVLDGRAESEKLTTVSEPIRKDIMAWGKRLVDAKVLDPQTYKRGLGTYLHRTIAKYETQNPLKAFMYRKFKLYEKQFKHRGVPPKQVANKNVNAWLAGEKDGSTWEILKVGKASTTIWRDWTENERESHGEIMDAVHAVARTFEAMAKSVGYGEFFSELSENSNVAKSEWEPGMVQVPGTRITKGGTYKFGKLHGKYVSKDDYDYIMSIANASDAVFWKPLVTFFKKNKTYRNPGTHLNNFLQNIMWSDFKDVPWKTIVQATKEYKASGKWFKEAEALDVFGHDIITQELRDSISTPTETETKGGMKGLADRMVSHMGRADEKARALYQAEDGIFRLAYYIDRVQKGNPKDIAADGAIESFIDYEINAPWIKKLRDTGVVPFISWPYKALPLMIDNIMRKPWKLAKWATIFYAANLVAQAVVGGDEEKERELLPEHMKGWSPFGPTALKVPFRSAGDLSIYADISRKIPFGDVFNFTSTQVGPFGFGGPVFMPFEIWLNKQAYSDREIVTKRIDSVAEQIGKYAKFVWRGIMPNIPGLPYSYATSNIMAAATSREDWLGRDQSVLAATAGGFGLKGTAINIEKRLYWKQKEFDRDIRKLKGKITSAKFSPTASPASIAKAEDKYNRRIIERTIDWIAFLQDISARQPISAVPEKTKANIVDSELGKLEQPSEAEIRKGIKPFAINPPARYLTIKNKKIELTQTQYDKYVEDSGNSARTMLERLTKGAWWKKATRIQKEKNVQKIVKKSRANVRDNLKRQLGDKSIPGMGLRKRPAWQKSTFGKKSAWQKSAF